MTELNRPPRRNMSRPAYAPLTTPIPPETAEAEPEQERVFAPDPPPPPAIERRRATRVYTIHAFSPAGFAVELAFSDITLDRLEAHLARLAELGYTPETKASTK